MTALLAALFVSQREAGGGGAFSFWLQAKLNMQQRWKKDWDGALKLSALAVYKYCVNKYDIAIFNQIVFFPMLRELFFALFIVV